MIFELRLRHESMSLQYTKQMTLNSKDALDFRKKKIVNSPFEIVLLLTASNVNVSRTIRLGRTGTVNE